MLPHMISIKSYEYIPIHPHTYIFLLNFFGLVSGIEIEAFVGSGVRVLNFIFYRALLKSQLYPERNSFKKVYYDLNF